eukprot:5810681-Prymnesium_polylepis.2
MALWCWSELWTAQCAECIVDSASLFLLPSRWKKASCRDARSYCLEKDAAVSLLYLVPEPEAPQRPEPRIALEYRLTAHHRP